MKTKNKAPAPARPQLTDDEIRDYAFHLYEQSGRIPGRDLDNWLEAKACLEANIPKHRAHVRLHRHRHPEAVAAVAMVALDAEGIPVVERDPRGGGLVDEGGVILLGAPPP